MTTLDAATEARMRIVSRIWDDLITEHAEADLRNALGNPPTCRELACELRFCGDLPWEPGDMERPA